MMTIGELIEMLKSIYQFIVDVILPLFKSDDEGETTDPTEPVA